MVILHFKPIGPEDRSVCYTHLRALTSGIRDTFFEVEPFELFGILPKVEKLIFTKIDDLHYVEPRVPKEVWNGKMSTKFTLELTFELSEKTLAKVYPTIDSFGPRPLIDALTNIIDVGDISKSLGNVTMKLKNFERTP